MQFFNTGRPFYTELESLIQNARQEILINTYSFHWDSIGKKFTALLAAAASRGVKVRVIFDGYESFGDRTALLDTLRAGGVETRVFRSRQPYFWRHPASYFHRD